MIDSNDTYSVQGHAKSLTVAQLEHMLDTVPESAQGSPLHIALREELNSRIREW
jgi:hypothetical protein